MCSDKLYQDLQKLGVQSGNIIMVHASMRAIGKAKSAADVVHALLAALGSTGTLLAYVDFQPTAACPYFDVKHSPARVEYGVLAEIIRTWPGAVRSHNPGASIVAIGAQAKWLCTAHPLHYGYGPGSPLAKLVNLNGKVLLLGSDYNNVTLLHYAEHRAHLPNKRIIRRTDKVLANGQIIDLEIEEFDTSRPIIAAMPGNYFAELTHQFIDSGQAQVGTVGAAHSVLLPAAPFAQFAIQKMEQDFASDPLRK